MLQILYVCIVVFKTLKVQKKSLALVFFQPLICEDSYDWEFCEQSQESTKRRSSNRRDINAKEFSIFISCWIEIFLIAK